MTRRYAPALLFGLLLTLPAVLRAGPNQGGALVVHAPPSITYTTDQQSYCGQSGLTFCSQVVDSIASEPEVPRVWFVLASFDPSSSPRLKALSYGVWYDSTRLAITAHGSCGDFELPDDRWPRPGSGTALSWTQPQTDVLEEISWFAGYTYAHAPPDTASFCIIPHPRHGGEFVDDAVPPAIDSIAAYGRLGFGCAPLLICYEEMPDEGEQQSPAPSPVIPPPGEEGDTEPGHVFFGATEIALTWDDLRFDAAWESLWELRHGADYDTLCFHGFPVTRYRNAYHYDPFRTATPFDKERMRILQSATDAVRDAEDVTAQAEGFCRVLGDVDPEHRYHIYCRPTGEGVSLAYRDEDGGLIPSCGYRRLRRTDQLLPLPNFLPRLMPAEPRDIQQQSASLRRALASGAWVIHPSLDMAATIHLSPNHVPRFRELLGMARNGVSIDESMAPAPLCRGFGMDAFWRAVTKAGARGGH